MLPTTPEVLRSMRYSLSTILLPNITDPWAIYVAKAMQRMIQLLERRYEFEEQFLTDDTAELLALFGALDDGAAGLGLGDEELTAALRTTEGDRDAPGPRVPLRDLDARNQALRARLVTVIRALDDVSDAPDAPDVQPLREHIRTYLDRQMERDVRIAEPSFMSFAPPVKEGK